MTTLFINGSSRKTGNTVALGNRVLAGIPHDTIHLIDHRLNFDYDQRETGQPQRDLTDDYEGLMTTFAAADDIVLGTPVYWYSMSGQLKVFMDRWFDSKTNGFSFAGKRVYLLVVGVDDPQHKASGIAPAVRDSCEWLDMAFMGSATVIGDGPDDVRQLPDLPAAALAVRETLLKHATVSRETSAD